MDMLQSGRFYLCLCLLLCMIAAGIYLLLFMISKTRRNDRIALFDLPVLFAAGIFVLTLGSLTVMLLTGGVPQYASANSTKNVQKMSNSQAFSAESDELVKQVILGATDIDSARDSLKQLDEKYFTAADGELYRSALSLLTVAQEVSGYLNAFKNGDNGVLDRLVRFYYEDYSVNRLNYASVPEYRLFKMISEQKLLAGDPTASAIIKSSTNAYIDYCMHCHATKTRFEILLNLTYLLNDLGFDNELADTMSQKANKALRIITSGELVLFETAAQ